MGGAAGTGGRGAVVASGPGTCAASSTRSTTCTTAASTSPTWDGPDRLAAGDSPLDGIFTPLGLGFPLFQHYQVLPYLLTAPFAPVFGVQDAYVGVLYLLLVLWPAACTSPCASWSSTGGWRPGPPWWRRSS